VGPTHRIVFVIGFDAFRDFHTWRDYVAIFGLCDVVVVTRPPWPERLDPEAIPVAAREAFWYDSSSESFRHRSGHVLTLQRITSPTSRRPPFGPALQPDDPFASWSRRPSK